MIRSAAALSLLLLAACGSRPPAPVFDRSGHHAAGDSVPAGHYRVNRGDTLYAIAFSLGLDFRQLARWNGLSHPYVIYPGQDLRLSAPDEPPARSAPRPSPTSRAPAPKAAPAQASAERPAASASPAAKPQPRATVQAGDPDRWLWPAGGRVLRGYVANDPARNGLDIAGREGEAVKATAGGTVVYSGSGLIGYGELIIIKHSDRMLSAYGHNRRRLVDEGAQVNAGQKIAELGRNDRNEQLLHFEIRLNGKPVDPRQYLPPR